MTRDWDAAGVHSGRSWTSHSGSAGPEKAGRRHETGMAFHGRSEMNAPRSLTGAHAYVRMRCPLRRPPDLGVMAGDGPENTGHDPSPGCGMAAHDSRDFVDCYAETVRRFPNMTPENRGIHGNPMSGSAMLEISRTETSC